LHLAQRPLTKAFSVSPGDTDVTGDARNSEAGRLATINLNTREDYESSLTSCPGGVALSFAVPALMAQDAMKVVTADELVWKEHPLFKGAQSTEL